MNRAERAQAFKQATLSYAERCYLLALEFFPNLGATEIRGCAANAKPALNALEPRGRCERGSRGSGIELQGSF